MKTIQITFVFILLCCFNSVPIQKNIKISNTMEILRSSDPVIQTMLTKSNLTTFLEQIPKQMFSPQVGTKSKILGKRAVWDGFLWILDSINDDHLANYGFLTYFNGDVWEMLQYLPSGKTTKYNLIERKNILEMFDYMNIVKSNKNTKKCLPNLKDVYTWNGFTYYSTKIVLIKRQKTRLYWNFNSCLWEGIVRYENKIFAVYYDVEWSFVGKNSY